MSPAQRRNLLLVATLLTLALPTVLSDYSMRLINLGMISAIAVIGLAVAFGWAGLVHLGQAAFVGIGAYSSAIMAKNFGLSFWTALPVALVITLLVSLAIGAPMLRLRGHYLALATVGFNVTAEIVTKNWGSVTGGYDGISGIPSPDLFGYSFDTDRTFFFFAWGWLFVAALFAFALRHSRFGRAMIAVRDDEMAAGTSSVAVFRTKILAFGISALFGALSGSLYAHYSNYLAPQDFEVVRAITLLVMLIVGGETSIPGAIIGAVLLTFLPEWLRFLGEAYLAVFGAGVLLVLVLMPQGIAGSVAKLWKPEARRVA